MIISKDKIYKVFLRVVNLPIDTDVVDQQNNETHQYQTVQMNHQISDVPYEEVDDWETKGRPPNEGGDPQAHFGIQVFLVHDWNRIEDKIGVQIH